jgi:tripartite-type tricarboxylate transporter receptor subunit TctC
MPILRDKRLAVVLVFSMVVVLLAGCNTGGTTSGPAAAEFYKGKPVNLIVPYSPGGGFDQYPRLAQPALEAALGTTVVVQNVTGAGGIVGSNAIYRAAPDGLTIGIGSIGGLAFAAATGVEGVQYDLGKFTWLGRVYAEPRAIVVNAKGTINTIADLKKLNRPVLISATGVGSDDYYIALILFKGLGIPVKMATGYSSQPESNLAILRGEVDCTVSSLGGVQSALDGGDLKAILFLADAPVKGYEKVALVKDQGLSGDNQALVDAAFKAMELERSFIAPPGIPADRVAFLRAAFNKAFSDPATLDVMAKAKRPVVWLDGKTCEDKIATVVKSAGLLTTAIKAALAP